MSAPPPQAADRYKLVFFCPPTALPALKTAIFATGAGHYPKYSECCFTTPGIGQFRPSANANPNIGTPGELEEVGEVRCEILCTGRDVVGRAVQALKGRVGEAGGVGLRLEMT